MLPDFTDKRLLPAGVHRATWEEFEKRFVYFDQSDRRFRLFDKLRELYQQAKRSGIVKRILVGGSYVTEKSEPNDFDCILVIDASIEGTDLRQTEYNLISRPRARRIFGGDVISVTENSSHYHEYMNTFQTSRNKDRVGIVEIEL